MRTFRPLILVSVIMLFLSASSFAQNKETERMQKSAEVLKDFGDMKEEIPEELLNIAEGIIIVPKMINAGFVVGGKRGRGVALARNEDGSWSDPFFITITGGSVGFQVGIQSVDLVLIFRHRSTLEKIGNGTFTLGGDASATAGPVGRSTSANTDYKFEAEVYSYSKSKGLFAGISLSGSAITVDANANTNYYGNSATLTNILSGKEKGNGDINNLKGVLESLTKGDNQ